MGIMGIMNGGWIINIIVYRVPTRSAAGTGTGNGVSSGNRRSLPVPCWCGEPTGLFRNPTQLTTPSEATNFFSTVFALCHITYYIETISYIRIERNRKKYGTN